MPNVPRSSGRVVKLITANDQARRRPVGKQLAALVDDASLGGCDARTPVDDDPLAPDHAGVGCDRTDEVRLHLERRVADAGSSSVWTAQPIAESSSVSATPPCTEPIGL